jgi:hypothetical protein
MFKKLIKFIKNNMDSNTEQFSMRIPNDLKKPLEKKAKSLRLPLPDYVRAIMLNSILPEILDSELKKVTCEWITKQGKDSVEIHFGEKIKRLKEIVDIASYAIEETEKLQQKFIDVEVEYLDIINSKLH